MEQELAYSFHLGSDKNKSKLAKKVAKENISGTTSLSNNAIQNANDLSKVNKHNLRDYDNKRELIRVIYGTDNIVNDVKDTTKTVRSVNDLNVAIRDFEHSAFEIEKENRSLKYQIEEKDKEIYNLKGGLSAKDKIINKLQEEKESIKAQLHKFKEFWHSIMKYFHQRICYDKDNNYKIVSADLYKNGIFTDDENEIANNIARKVKPKDEINNDKNKMKKKDVIF